MRDEGLATRGEEQLEPPPVGAPPRPTPPAPRPLFSRPPHRWRVNLLPLLFLFWSALVALWYYGSDLRAAGLTAVFAVGPAKLAIAAAALVAGGLVLFVAARRQLASRRTGWAALAILGLGALAAGLTPGLRGRVLVALFVLATLAAAVGLGALLLRALGVRSRSAAEALG